MPSATSTGQARSPRALNDDPAGRTRPRAPGEGRLPDAFAPISVTISPAATENETPRSAWIAP
jgi:hypothetical protein